MGDFEEKSYAEISIDIEKLDKEGKLFEDVPMRRLKEGVVNKETIKLANQQLRECYELINEIIQDYMDIPLESSKLISIWILGTYFHKNFETFPYLFLNAMKGSGKTRLLKLIEKLAWKCKLTNNLTEAVLFRTANNATILIDEFENISGKEKVILKELLHSAYKNGSYVERIKKVVHKDGEDRIVERFPLFSPVCMANISGMDDVLGDRCISIILDKSSDKIKTKLTENFRNNIKMSQISVVTGYLVSFVLANFSDFIDDKTEKRALVSLSLGNVYDMWNDYVNDTNNTNNSNNTNNTNNTTTQQQYSILKGIKIEKKPINKEIKLLFEKINKTDINGRNLELFFPLFILSWKIGDDVLEDMLEISKKIIKEKKSEEYAESYDIALIEFVSQKETSLTYYPLSELLIEFKLSCNIDSNDFDINSKWMGKALKRLNLIIDKKRKASGREFMLNVEKAKEKIRMFR